MNSKSSFELRIPLDIGNLNGYTTPEYIANHLSWRIETKQVHSRNQRYLGLFLHCNIEEPGPSDWSCIAKASIRLLSQEPGQHFIEKSIYFMEFNSKQTRRDYERFIAWKDVPQFTFGNKITIHVKIEAIIISNANNLISLRTQVDDGKLKVRISLKEIRHILGAVSSEIDYGDATFKMYIFKRTFEHDENDQSEDALWLYLYCRSKNNNLINLSYNLKLLTDNKAIGPLCAGKDNITFSNLRDAVGAPFIVLNELFDPANAYVSSSGGIVLYVELAMQMAPKPSNDQPKVMVSEMLQTQECSDAVQQTPQRENQSENRLADQEPSAPVMEPSEIKTEIKTEPDDVDAAPPNDDFDEMLHDFSNNFNDTQNDFDNGMKNYFANVDFMHDDPVDLMYQNPNQTIDDIWNGAVQEPSNLTNHANLANQSNTTENENCETEVSKLHCIYCNESLLDKDTCYSLMCGHLYCISCLEFDIAIRKSCIKCDKRVNKNQWFKLNLSHQEDEPPQSQTTEMSAGTSSSSNLNVSQASVGSLDTTMNESNDDQMPGPSTMVNDRKRKHPKGTLNCTRCTIDLLQTKTYAIKCGCLYCRDCFDECISDRKSCIKCNKRFNKNQSVKVFLYNEDW